MSLQVYELTQATDWNRHNSYGAVIVDTVTDIPLPLQLFPNAECAEHFLIWAEREGREPFGTDKFYNAKELYKAFGDWWNESMSEDGDTLTDQAQAEWATRG